MSRKYQYQRLPDTSTAVDLPHHHHYSTTKRMRRNSRDFIHHRSVLFGILIGLAFALIALFTLLPSLSINYYDTQSTISSGDTSNTLFTTFAGSSRYARHHRHDEDAPR